MDDAGKEGMRKRYSDFTRLWSDIAGTDENMDAETMVMCYYLDVIAGQLMELNKPKPIVMPMQAGRN